MNRRLVFLLLTVWTSMLIQVGPILAQGLILKLPSDGTWSRFRVTGQYDISWLRDLKEFPDEWKDIVAAIPDFAHGEMELVVSSVGTDKIDGERFRWIELYLKSTTVGESKGDEADEGTLLRLQVAEKVLTTGGDLLDNARTVFVRGGYSPSDDGEIKNDNRRKYELQRFRQFFPKYSVSDKDWAHVRNNVKDGPHPQIERAIRFRFNYQGKMHGGEHGSLIHHANYTVITDPIAPFGVKQIWETDGVSIEDSGPYNPNDENCDGPGTISRGNSQIVLIESGTDAVSRLKTLTTQNGNAP